MFLWIVPALTIGSAIYGAVKGRGGKKGGTDPRMVAFDRAAQRTGQRGEQAEQEYLRRIREFDPMQAATAANTAQYNQAMPQIQRAVTDLRGSQVGRGRINTGYGMGDEDQLITDNLNNLNQSMIARSMEATRMGMANNQMLGGYATDARNMYMDATMGRYMTEEQQRMADEASKRSMWGSLLGAGIGAVGSYYGAKRA